MFQTISSRLSARSTRNQWLGGEQNKNVERIANKRGCNESLNGKKQVSVNETPIYFSSKTYVF